MSKINVNTWEPETGTAATLMATGDTVTVPSGATLAVASGATIANSGTATGFSGSNAPAFHVVKTATQDVGDDVSTKITFDSTIFDTGSGVDLTNNKYVVPSGEGGKYFVYAQTYVYSNASHALQEINCPSIRIDGTSKLEGNWRSVSYPAAQFALYTAGILELSAANYIEIFVHTNVSSSTGTCSGSAAGKHTFFGAFKLDGIA